MPICPIMSYQKQYSTTVYCAEKDCGFYDKNKYQCAILSIAQKEEKRKEEK